MSVFFYPFTPCPFPQIFVLRTKPNRSHTQNAGDRHINRMLQDAVRKASKRRLFQHAMDVQAGLIPAGQKLNMGEVVMKQCLVRTIECFLRDPRLPGWILSSFRIVLGMLRSHCPVSIFLFRPFAGDRSQVVDDAPPSDDDEFLDVDINMDSASFLPFFQC